MLQFHLIIPYILYAQLHHQHHSYAPNEKKMSVHKSNVLRCSADHTAVKLSINTMCNVAQYIPHTEKMSCYELVH